MFFRNAMNEHVDPDPEGPSAGGSTLRHARMPVGKAQEFYERALELADELAGYESVPGERVYGVVAGVYLTDLPEISAEQEG
jgi:hypothetical protein